MRYRAKYDGYEIELEVCSGGVVEIRVPDIPGRQVYSTEDRAIDAIRRYDLSLRKNFTNKKAYMRDSRRGVREVEVTSVSQDGKEAWTVYEGTRRLVFMDKLYADRASVEAAIEADECLCAQRDQLWENLTRWLPQSEPAEPDGSLGGGATEDVEEEESRA